MDSRPGTGGGPGAGCVCARRAAEKAEMAAAEDFDPLRIRPYVTLGVDTAPADADGGLREQGPHRIQEDAATTMPLFLGPAGSTAGRQPDAVDPAGPARPADLADPTRTLAPAGPARPAGAPAEESGASHRRRPFVAVAVGAALAAVVGTAAFATGLLGGGDDGDTGRRQALPGTAVDVPGASVSATEPAPVSVPPSPSASPSVSPSASATASPSASTSPSASASTSSSPPASATPSHTTSSPSSSAPPASLAGPALRPGDQGPAVAELQRRLEEIWLYHGRDDGDYSNQVEHAVSVYQSYKAIEGDPPGVYGPETRRALEAETTGR
ncbi:peptidoglycan-binding protein [Streptomyces sp. NBC_00893]|uniref:peptidoglycan-binding domain-containing protein n=1 Tax=Streptomyces sp. NBC_00893 TaxID=2975862 RepID=UPI00225AA9BE|nr:peptidoglycan-binding domain-containing protein [Streptomyces sp. NBC_00893]MCX4848231.1 peptidoglycan-binding protein [Streptomyces sp. NBC_00893]